MTESNTASVLANALRERASGAAAAPPLTALYAQAEGSEHADGPPGEQLGAFDLGVVPIDALAHRRPRRAAVAVAAAALVAAAVAAAVVGSGAFGGPRHPARYRRRTVPPTVPPTVPTRWRRWPRRSRMDRPPR
jgi:hypothetical protein